GDVGQCDFSLQIQLYDLKTDPEARSNIAGRRPEVETSLKQLVGMRLRQGLGGGVGPISAAAQTKLASLGYLGSTVEGLVESFRQAKTETLIELAAGVPGDCLTRREIAKALAERKSK